MSTFATSLPRQRGLALPLAALYAALVVYASLYPFEGWRWPGGATWPELLRLPWPRAYLPFDVWANFIGYMPLGLLVFAAALRSRARRRRSWLAAIGLPAALSFAMEVTQHFIPGRYPSAMDWALNAAGGVAGAGAGQALAALRWIGRWHDWRERWFIRRSTGALVLMLLWPVGLLFPAPLPLGLGIGWDRVQDLLIDLFTGVPWAAEWLAAVSEFTVSEDRLHPLLENIGVALGLLGPCLLAYAVVRPGWRRWLLAAGAAALGLAATTLSAALNFGPAHATAWVSPGVPTALALALAVALALARISPGAAAGLGIAALSALAVLVGMAPADAYFTVSLQDWEQGRFIRFHGVAQWIGWLWPYAAIAWLAASLAPEPR